MFITALLFLAPLTAFAYELQSGSFIQVDEGKQTDGSLYAVGSTVTINGRVPGDLFCAAQNVKINGQVDGSVFCAAQTIDVSGKVGGSVRALGQTVSIDGQVGQNLMAAGAALSVGKQAQIGWDILFGAASADIQGKVGQGIIGGASSVNLSGPVGKNIRLWIDSSQKPGLYVSDAASIGGDLAYTGKSEAEIKPGAKISGKVTRNTPKETAKKQAGAWGSWSLLATLGAILVGLVLVSLWKRQMIGITDVIAKKPGPSFGWGAIFVFLSPIIAVLFLITLVGIPLAFLIFAVWGIFLYLGKIFVGIFIGRKLLENFWAKKKDSLMLAMTIGIICAYILFGIPFLGGLCAFAAVLWGIGGFYQFVRPQN